MKPLHVGLLMVAAAIVGGIAVKLTQAPTPHLESHSMPSAVLAVPAAGTVSTPDTGLNVRRRGNPARKPAKGSRVRPQTDAALPPVPASVVPFGDRPFNGISGGIFSGADPNDPRIYHLAER